MHFINNASNIFLFSIQYALLEMIYFECRNKQFEEKKTRLATGGKIIIKSKFYFPVASFNHDRRVCKTSIKKNNGRIAFWYKHQNMSVKGRNATSTTFANFSQFSVTASL